MHQVQEETSSSPSSTATTVAAPTQQPVHPAAKAVRRIKLSTPPTAATTEIFDISEDTVAEFALEPADPDFVQMVTATTAEDPPVEEDEPALIILDSGPTQAWFLIPSAVEAAQQEEARQRSRTPRATRSTAAPAVSLTFGSRPPTASILLCQNSVWWGTFRFPCWLWGSCCGEGGRLSTTASSSRRSPLVGRQRWPFATTAWRCEATFEQ